MIYVSIILATLFVQIPNIWAVKALQTNGQLGSILFIALMCLPASYAATVFYAYYYGRGYETLSYPTLAVTAYGTGLLISVLIQVVVLKAKTVTGVEVLGMTLVIAGLLLIVFKDRL